jgi:biotin carboxyl carrier protein
MLRHYKIMLMIVVLMLALGTWVMAAGSVDQKAVLSGQVSAGALVAPGASVHEGDILVQVETLAGAVPAVRATLDGKVIEVLVKPGDSIRSGEVVVRVEPVRK